MKKVLLIAPYNQVSADIDAEQRLYMKKIIPAPPLGLYRMKSWLRGKHEVDVFDPNLHDQPYAFLSEWARYYDIIGFSLTHATLEHDLGLIWHTHKHMDQKNTLLIVGGEEATFNRQLILDHTPIRLFIAGEGEKILESICTRGVDLANRSYAICSKPLGFDGFHDVSMKIDFRDIPYEQYWENMDRNTPRTIRLFTSNYCPNGCRFCSSTNFHEFSYGRKERVVLLSSTDLILLVQRAVEAHPTVETIFFQDDNFLGGEIGHRRALSFCLKVLDAKKEGTIPEKLTFMCQTRVTDVDDELLKLMKLAGFWLVSYGVESFSQNILNELGKKITVNQIEQALEWTFEARIKPFINIILTSPNCELGDVVLTAVKCDQYLARGAGLGINLYVIPFAGAEIVTKEEVRHLIEYRKVTIPGTDVVFRKNERILPGNKDVRDLVSLINQLINTLPTNMTSHKKSTIILQACYKALIELERGAK